jgi:plasmid stabilization system protein ParE
VKVRLLSVAYTDVTEAAGHYQAQRRGLGQEFRREVHAALRRIRELPDAWQPLGGGVRQYRLRRFPYGVIYAVREERVVVLAVTHLHRHPDAWRSRLQ